MPGHPKGGEWSYTEDPASGFALARPPQWGGVGAEISAARCGRCRMGLENVKGCRMYDDLDGVSRVNCCWELSGSEPKKPSAVRAMDMAGS